MKKLFMIHLSKLFLFGPIFFNPFLEANEPVCVYYNPHSILQNPTTSPLYAGNRGRFATCADVRWLSDGKHLILVNLLANSVSFCLYHEGEVTFIKEIDLHQLFGVIQPEKCVFSPKKDLLVIASKGGIDFFKIESLNLIPLDSYPSIKIPKTIVHDVAFSPCGKYLVCGLLDAKGSLVFFERFEGGYKKISVKDEIVKGLKPKGIVFSKDGNYLIVVVSQTVGYQKKERQNACLMVYRFDKQSGHIESRPLSVVQWDGVIESLAFSPDDKSIFATDQFSDQVIEFSLSQSSGTLGKGRIFLRSPQGELSFPHGLSFSPDGRCLAVSNFGNDSVTIYRYDP